MFCIRNLGRNCISAPVRLILKANYSRRSNENTITYEVIKTKDETLDDIEKTVIESNPNWELLTPRGYRFYLPGCIGPGWLDASTVAQPAERTITDEELMILNENDLVLDKSSRNKNQKKHRGENDHFRLEYSAQECPMVLRKDLLELFPGVPELNVPHLTIVTLTQKACQRRGRWSKEVETEKFAKYFVMAASDLCAKLKFVGFWADFINPFSGQSYHNPQKLTTLYKSDARFRCLGFTIDKKNHCKIISYDDNSRHFTGHFYTTGPSNKEFLRKLVHDYNNMEED